jgi:hypothetical protein
MVCCSKRERGLRPPERKIKMSKFFVHGSFTNPNHKKNFIRFTYSKSFESAEAAQVIADMFIAEKRYDFVWVEESK